VQKKKVLVWSDCVLASTGFGTVSKHILAALHATGRYEIDQLAINYFGDFYDKNKVPYCLVPAKLGNSNDPYGNQMFVNALLKKEYDIVFIINDTFVVEEVGRNLAKAKHTRRARGMKDFNLVYYYPVDCRLLPSATSMIKAADRSVAYTYFAKQSSEAIDVHPTDVIYHGTDPAAFYPIPKTERDECRAKYVNVKPDDDTFVLVNVNRNSLRKDMAKVIYAFNEFKKLVPKSKLYLHTKIQDGVGGHVVDLRVPIEELGLHKTKDVIFPAKFDAARGFPTSILNQLYNCGDAFLTTHLGEGWGLTTTEAMAAGIPVIAPDNTTTPEILGMDRGYVYPCKEMVYVDNSGYRPSGRIEDIVEQMVRCHEDWVADRNSTSTTRSDIIEKAKSFVRKHSWQNICKQWVTLFDSLQSKPFIPLTEGETV
jgi:glycosyltransferase involved in cell wall biosynthesis